MISPTSLIPLAYVCCGLLPLRLVPYTRAHGEKPGSGGLLVSLVGLSIWSIAYGFAISLSPYSAILFTGSLAILGSQLATIGYLLVAVEYTDVVEVTPRLLAALGAFPLAVQLVSLTEPIHGRMWGPTSRPVVDTTATESLATVVVVATMAIGAAAALLFLIEAATASGVRRKQSVALVAAGFPTLLITIVDVYVIEEYVYSLLPFGVVISAFAIAWALFRMDFLDVVPVARKRIVEEMDDAALVLDADDRVVECNRAARRLGRVGPDYAGMPIEEFFDSVPDAVERFRDESGVDTEITVTPGGEPQHFHLKISRLERGRESAPTGRLVVLRDITPLKRRERALEQRESELEFLRQVLTRILRHNIRNDLTVVRGYASTIADDEDPEIAEMAAEIVATSDDLLETSQRARAIERVIDRDTDPDRLDLSAIVRELAADYRERYPDTAIAVEAPDRCPVEADPWLETAFGILLESALEHDDGDGPTVEVRVERTSTRATVTIADDGSGLPSDELAVLERGEETALEQVSGIGLWIVHWIVDRSAASIAYDTDDSGTRVSIRIPTDRARGDGDDRRLEGADR